MSKNLMSKDLIIIIGITVLMIMVYGKYWGNGSNTLRNT